LWSNDQSTHNMQTTAVNQVTAMNHTHGSVA